MHSLEKSSIYTILKDKEATIETKVAKRGTNHQTKISDIKEKVATYLDQQNGVVRRQYLGESEAFASGFVLIIWNPGMD